MQTSSRPTPTISVLIPARDEERNIQGVLQSILAQTHQPIEILVLDDHSTDQTASIVRELAANYQQVKLMKGKPLEPDWQGKSFACHQLAKQAKGDWFLFLDADVRLEKDAVEKLVPSIESQGSGMISGFPRQIVRTISEKLIVTMMMFVILCHLPIWMVRKSKQLKFVAAHGGFILINRKSYQTCGGHESIKGELLDDMALMKQVKLSQQPTTLLKVDSIVHMRMYHNVKGVWHGFSKNIFTGMNRNFLLLSILVISYVWLYVFPFFVLIQGVVTGDLHIFALVAYLLAIVTKSISDVSNGVSAWYGLFIPFSILGTICIALHAAMRSFYHLGYAWKGRRYF
ncbi:glycosyltransferase [Aquibacillus koreensis]|nr:glycosyltransferase family 2 protein [Aquibacillus koreensis]